MATALLKTHAIRLLARREYSRTELEERLVAEGADRIDVRAALEELVGEGLLSNQRYAHAVATQKANRYSRRSISRDLKAKGVEADVINAALADAGIDDQAAMTALWQRRFGQAPANDREKARQVRFLQARGFALSAILKLLRDAAAGMAKSQKSRL